MIILEENKYNDSIFLEKYLNMQRSVDGLDGAGEWHEFKKVIPNLKNKNILDLGCGLGWHCQYAIDNGASTVVGVDISKKMLEIASNMTSKEIKYINSPIEEVDFVPGYFDVIISSLAIHYIEDYKNLIEKIHAILSKKGVLIFSVEHPVFTAKGDEQWVVDDNGNNLYWPVDNYFSEGIRNTLFLDEEVKKYHRTVTTYANTLIASGFKLTNIIEPKPDKKILDKTIYEEELRRPMMLIFSAIKED